MSLISLKFRPLSQVVFKCPVISLHFYSNLVKENIRKEVISRLQPIHRNMSTAPEVVNIDINDVKKFQKDPSATLVDVREISEIKETGKLPGSVNIPLGALPQALQENSEAFQQKYGRPKPLVDNPIVFSCRSGRRSFMASEAALSQGYKRVFNYAGGWLDWEENSGKSETC